MTVHLIFHARGPLDVSTSPDGDRVVLHLRDTGTGDIVDVVLDSPDEEIRLGHKIKSDGRQARNALDRGGEHAITRAMAKRRGAIEQREWTAEEILRNEG